MQGRVFHATETYALIKACTGETFLALPQRMPVDEIGRTYLVLNELVEFERGTFNDPNGNPREQATNIRLVTPRPVVDSGSSVEEGVVMHVSRRGEFCFVSRPFGGSVFLHNENVRECQSKNEHDGPYFFDGQVWSYRVAPPLVPGRNWLAVDARELCAEE